MKISLPNANKGKKNNYVSGLKRSFGAGDQTRCMVKEELVTYGLVLYPACLAWNKAKQRVLKLFSFICFISEVSNNLHCYHLWIGVMNQDIIRLLMG